VTGALFFGLAVLVDAGAASLSWRQARRACAPTGGDLAALVPTLKRLPASERLEHLRQRAPPGSWADDLASEALGAADEASRVAAINQALSEVDHALTEGAGWPRAGVRIALLASALLAVAAFLVEGAWSTWSLSILALGGAAVLTCWEAGRSARRGVANQRRAVDELIGAVFGDAARSAEGTSRRPGLERHARPRRRGS
jgi:hypothetical protein